MEVGIVGKPNVGKSTFFKAATMAEAEVASYPFTTIKANIAWATSGRSALAPSTIISDPSWYSPESGDRYTKCSRSRTLNILWAVALLRPVVAEISVRLSFGFSSEKALRMDRTR